MDCKKTLSPNTAQNVRLGQSLIVFGGKALIDRWEMTLVVGIDGSPHPPLNQLRISLVQNKINKVEFVTVRFRTLYWIFIAKAIIIPIVLRRNIS